MFSAKIPSPDRCFDNETAARPRVVGTVGTRVS